MRRSTFLLGFTALRAKRSIDLPLLATLTRTGKGKYVADIKFAKSHRVYGSELIFAPNAKLARAHVNKLYPTLKWSK